ncbi:MAG: 1-deoxy-D-xylulose-5-phosphate synthase N-terminal domain-containing protein [Mycoplasma sp.]
MSKILINNVKNVKDYKKLNHLEDLTILQQTRDLIIKTTETTGGHLSSSLSALEISYGIIKEFDLEKDKILFDIGHNTYGWKILTGRAKRFETLKQFNGLKGFQSRKESKYDFIEQGNAGNSLSIAAGWAFCLKKNEYIVNVIGDQSFATGQIAECFNHLNSIKNSIIIALNDNSQGIGPNIGSLGTNDINYQNYCLTYGINYIGPVDGHNLNEISNAFKKAKTSNKHTLIHFKTIKGHGHEEASQDKVGKYHSIPTKNNYDKWSNHYPTIIDECLKKNKNVYLITAGMQYALNLHNLYLKYPKQTIDVGIAEDHAVSFASGVALSNNVPVVFVGNCFLRKGYDQIVQDIALMNLHCVFIIDQSGINEGGNVQHGFYDLKMFVGLDNAVIYAPSNSKEFQHCLELGITKKQITVIRINKYYINDEKQKFDDFIWIRSSSKKIVDNSSKLVISYDKLSNYVINTKKRYDLINLKQIYPLSKKVINIIDSYQEIILLEEYPNHFGLYSVLATHINQSKIKLIAPNSINIEHGNIDKLYNDNILNKLK